MIVETNLLIQGSSAYLEMNTGSMRAPIFYDYDDISYYLDMNSTSDSAGRIRGGILFGPNTTWGAYLRVGGNGDPDTSYANVAATNGNLHLDCKAGYSMYLNNYANGNIYLNGGTYYISSNGSQYNGNAATATGQQSSTNFTVNTGGAGYGLVGVYNPSVHQCLFAMGAAYTLTGGGGLSNFYGVSWTYDSAGYAINTGYNLAHCMAIANNGVVATVIGVGIWTNGLIRANGAISSGSTITATGNITGAYILGTYFNASAGNSENPTIGQIWTQSTGDDYLRKSTPAHFRSQIIDGYYVPSTSQSTWNSSTVIGNVVGLLAWKNYGNNHVIFDASQSVSPSGTSVNNTNSQIAWSAQYPTLMGWNGSGTYGVRVDSARLADSATLASAYLPLAGGVNMTGSFGFADNKIYLRTNGDNNHYIWNAADDWEEIVAYNGTGLRISTSTGTTLATFSASGNSMNITGNAATATTATTATTANNLAANTSPTIQVLNFTGVGGNSGNANQGYAIYQEGGAWAPPFPDLCIGYHTGIKLGAYFGYNGTRFYNNSDFATQTFSVNDGDNHVRVAYNLYVGGTISASNLSGTNTGDQTNISGNAATATYATSAGSAGSVTGLTLTSSANGINPDSVTQNQLGYNTSVNLFGQTDGGLYSSAYSSAWIHQIYGDFRTGQIAIRGKLSGTWQAWRVVLDSSNYTGYAPTLTGGGASGTWGISISGNSANTNSISSAVGGTYTWTGINYFETNQGGQAVNNSNSAKLQAYSSGNNSAFMSFHRAGYYAVNFGLDDDNYMRIGGWSAAANRWQLNLSTGATTIPGIAYSQGVDTGNGDLQWGGAERQIGRYRYLWYGYWSMWFDLIGGTGGGNLIYADTLYATYGSVSDIRYKKEVTPSTYGLSEVLKMNTIKYKYDLPIEKRSGNDPNFHIGFSAQDMLDIIPEAVMYDKNRGVYAIANGELIPVLVNSIKELKAEINELKLILNK